MALAMVGNKVGSEYGSGIPAATVAAGMPLPHHMPVVVVPACADLFGRAEALAKRLALPVTTGDAADGAVLLVVAADRLELRIAGSSAMGPVYVDFVGGAAGHRYRFGGGRGQLIAKAVGIKKGHLPSVVDATAGLGRDAFVLAGLGCRVRMVERSPVIAAVVADGVDRAALDPGIGTLVSERLSLTVADALNYLANLSAVDQPEVVYLDPMHPARIKSGLVKKEMRVVRAVVGDDGDSQALLEVARRCARRRVVVKLPRHAAVVGEMQPDLVFTGKSTRFDIYLSSPDGMGTRKTG